MVWYALNLSNHPLNVSHQVSTHTVHWKCFIPKQWNVSLVFLLHLAFAFPSPLSFYIFPPLSTFLTAVKIYLDNFVVIASTQPPLSSQSLLRYNFALISSIYFFDMCFRENYVETHLWWLGSPWRCPTWREKLRFMVEPIGQVALLLHSETWSYCAISWCLRSWVDECDGSHHVGWLMVWR